MIRAGLLSFAVIISAALLSAAGAAPKAPELPAVIDFNRHVRPIMSNTCFKCHGPDVKNNKSTLRLDLPDAAFAPHKNARGRIATPIVPGKPEQSEMWRRISSNDPGEKMPPAESLHLLSARDRAIFKRWIEQGAKYQPHWAYLAPVKVVPPVPSRLGAAARNPIDSFILAGLEAAGLTPAPEAARRTLIRRVSLDLIGLPPAPEEVEAFVADARPDAYERVVDRLLASPHYGERMAVPWLDVVRFADSVGYHGDQRQNIFPYRDYVIDAFNRNKPFDQFTREQIAGDLLPNATTEQRIATGFNRLNMMTREGGSQPKEQLAKYAADRVRAVSAAWLGSTVGCAECHDHKYDPFSTRDFYALAAYFDDVKQFGVYADYPYSPNAELAGTSHDAPFPPHLEIESDHLKRRAARLRAQFHARATDAARGLAGDPASAAAVREWSAGVANFLRAAPDGWALARPEKTVAAPGLRAVTLEDGSVQFGADRDAPATGAKKAGPVRTPDRRVTHVLTLAAPAVPVAAVRLELLPDEASGGRISRGKKDWVDVKATFEILRAGETKPAPLTVADGFVQPDGEYFVNGHLTSSVRERWRTDRHRVREPHQAVYLFERPALFAAGDRLVITLMGIVAVSDSVSLSITDAARVRLAVSPLGGRLPIDDIGAETLAAFRAAAPTLAQRELIAAEYFKANGAPDNARFMAAIDDLREIAECREGRALTMVTVATKPGVTRVLARGNWQDESGEIMAPAPPKFLTAARPAPARAPRQTRLDLANWLTSRDNPLTARTVMNRLWQQFFGTGLSAVLDDLGMQGEHPSHPELLDWLAVEFMEREWDVKAMVRVIVTSATYRQSSHERPELYEIDPQNRLLARQNARRLEAEFIRDNALAAAGLLSRDLGGPSVMPYQPEGHYANLNFPVREYAAHRDERQYRRGVYMHWQRTFLHPMLANFDAPSREECTAVRNLSSTPQQALTLLNDPTFVESARVLAERVLQDRLEADFAAQLGEAFRLVLARPPNARETESLRAFFEEQRAYFRGQPEDARKLTAVGLRAASPKIDRTELAAWTSLTRVLLNLNETTVRY